MPAHVPQAAIDLQISTCTVTHGTWYDWHSWAVELSDWKCSLRNIKKHTTWVITKDSKVTTYWKRSLCFWCPYLRDLSRSGVRDIFSTNNVQNDSSIFVINDVFFLHIAVSIYNLTFNKPSSTETFTNTYLSSHAVLLQCLRGSLSFCCQQR